MRLPLVPSRIAVRVLAGVPVVAAIVGAVQGSLESATQFLVAAAGAALGWALVDLVRSALGWHASPLRWERRLPAALALGVPHNVSCAVVNESPHDWWVDLDERADPAIEVQGLPLSLYVPAHSRIELHYTVVPRRRGQARFAPAELGLRTLGASFRWRRRSGDAQARRVYPDFTALARYDRLLRERRLGEIGVRNGATAGSRIGGEPLWLLLDCGQSVPADAQDAGPGDRRFDAALNALMLLAHVALAEGDEVGAMSFGSASPRGIAPRAGPAALTDLMSALYDLQPQAGPSDPLAAARELLRRQTKRAIVVVLSSTGHERAAGWESALRLLRTRHVVLLAGPRETARQGAELINRYDALKRAGLP